MKKGFILLFTLIFTITLIQNSSWALKKGESASITVNRVKLRAKPKLKSRFTLRFKKGDIVKILSTGRKQRIRRLGTHRWYKVSFKSKNGWIFGAYLTNVGAGLKPAPTGESLKKLQTWLKRLDKEYTIEELKSLTELSLWKNQLTTLPPEIGKLTNLQELDLRSNQLSSLPPEIGKLTNLQWLWLGGNKLSDKEKKKIKKLLPNCDIYF